MEMTIIESLEEFRSLFPFTRDKIGAVDLEVSMTDRLLDVALSVEEGNFIFVPKDDELIRYNLLESKNMPQLSECGIWTLEQ